MKGNAAAGSESVDNKIEETKRKIREMEEEDGKLSAILQDIEQQMSADEPDGATGKQGEDDVDSRSVYVGQVDYESTPEELQAHFQSCGTINRVTIICDKFTGRPKGYAYVEFESVEGAETAVSLNESIFRGRQLKVTVGDGLICSLWLLRMNGLGFFSCGRLGGIGPHWVRVRIRFRPHIWCGGCCVIICCLPPVVFLHHNSFSS